MARTVNTHLSERSKLASVAKNVEQLIKAALEEWKSKPRRMGCVNATDWFCKKVPSFKPLRLNKKTSTNGEYYEHVVATDGKRIIDLAPYADRPRGSK